MSTKTSTYEGLKAFLTGLGRSKPAALAFIAGYEQWPEAAQREIERRATAFLAQLPDEEVAAIARREVNLQEIAWQVQVHIAEE